MIPSVVISRLHCGKSLRRGYEIRRRARGASPLFSLRSTLNFLPLSPQRFPNYLLYYLLFPHSFAIFCIPPELNPFIFMQFRTLSQKEGVFVLPAKCFSRILSSSQSASLPSRTTMKLETVKPAVISNRCTYRSSSGRQCRLAIFDPQSGLCANHHADLKQNERADVANILFRDAQDFQTAQGINHSLR